MPHIMASNAHSNAHRARVLAGTAALAVCSALLSLCVGAAAVPLGEVVAALLGRSSGTAASIVLYVRLPRTLACLLAGGALAMAGVVIQGVLANPLAAPNIIGVNSGAGAAVALCCAIAPTAVALTPIAAFGGAFAGMLLVLFISQKAGASRMAVVLTGVALSSIFGAVVDALVTLYPDALAGYSDFRIGGMAGVTLARLAPAAAIALPAAALLLLQAHELDLLLLGQESAQSLGLPVRRARLLLLALAAALAGAAVSFAGLIGFVGLIVPHMLRRLLGEDSLPLLAGSLFGGAALLTVCDTAARTLFAPYELPVGIVLSLAGGPFFLGLLLRQKGGRHG